MERKLLWGQYLIWVILLLGQLHGCKSCIEKERKALLELKNDMISRSSEWIFGSVLPSWNNDTNSDCCRWEGTKCNRTSGRIIGLFFDDMMYFSESLLLNLSLLHPFEEVRSLNLSGLGYNGFFDDIEGYKSLRRFKNLEILDLSFNRFNNSIFPFLNAATSLISLSLRDSSMDGPFPFKELKDLENLELLDLRGNRFIGAMPGELNHLKKLKTLDLSSNQFYRSMAFQDLKNLTNLEVLGLANNNAEGPIPIEVFCGMKNLRELDLSENYLVDQLPLCLGSLHKLQVLDLSSNQFTGNLPSSFSSLESLEYLSLLDNNFTGLFSLDPLTDLTKLKVFKLSSTSGMIQLETESTWQSDFQLSVAVLRSCGLEKIPSFLVYQNNLRLLDLSSNRLSGEIPTWLLVNNSELEVLQLKNNSFTIFQMPTMIHNLRVLDFSANDISGLFPDNIGRVLPNLVLMNVSDNRFKGHFPSTMGEMMNIQFLDLSYNNFSGKLPQSFFTACFSLSFLKLSHNKFSGHFFPRRTNFTALNVLRMDNNLFSGKIGVGLFSSTFLTLLDISNNFLTGVIPSWIFNLSHLEYLMLSNNFFEGTISSSSLNMPSLSYLDLSENLFSGSLPSHVNSSILGKSLFLHDNNFTGPIPDTLLEHVQILDLRNNKLSGSIPQFVNTQSIYILLLRGNNLTGSIPRQLCDLRNIRLLDLSNNKLNGFIPSCLYNLTFGREEYVVNDYMRTTIVFVFQSEEVYRSTLLVEKLYMNYIIDQEIKIKFATKQRYDSYIGIHGLNDGILGYMYGMDLSNNELSGVIPAELGDLLKLRALNLSHNFLSSSIPSNFSNLKDIESLDLSYNMLEGNIPYQLTSLNFLAVFNVSYNNLSGIIPQGKQFNTFDKNIYLGNPLLCGSPTNRSCEANKNSHEADNRGEDQDEDEDEDDGAAIDMLVFYFSTASTYVTMLIGILVLMCFDSPWRRAWLRIVNAFIASAKSMFP